MEEYLKFLRGKIQTAPETGFAADPAQVNPALKPHQQDAVIWACRGGRRALKKRKEADDENEKVDQ